MEWKWSAGIYQSKDLCEAVQKGRLEEARVRLMAGEDVNALHAMGRTVLHLAASKSTAAVQLVLEFKPDVKVRVVSILVSGKLKCPMFRKLI